MLPCRTDDDRSGLLWTSRIRSPDRAAGQDKGRRPRWEAAFDETKRQDRSAWLGARGNHHQADRTTGSREPRQRHLTTMLRQTPPRLLKKSADRVRHCAEPVHSATSRSSWAWRSGLSRAKGQTQVRGRVEGDTQYGRPGKKWTYACARRHEHRSPDGRDRRGPRPSSRGHDRCMGVSAGSAG